MANKTLYALLVAINNYPIQRHCLRGCVADRDEFKNYLKRNFENSDVQLKIKTLTDSEATKANIIKHFQDFKKAKSDDICLFYFSGHGSQAPAPKEFWHMEPDRMSESVVCYDSRLPQGKDLMDKEQAYLIHEVTKANNPHFIAIFDCCHSGSNTRGVGDMYTARMAEPAHTPTKIDDYYGYQYYKKVQRDGYVDLSPPKGTHIQFAAAKSNETAKELKINGKVRGIFTYYLIESLEKTGSHLTYAELINAVNIRVSSKIDSQTPLMDVVMGGSGEISTLSQGLFLDGSIQPKPATYTINKKNNKWILDAGAIHGIPATGGTLQLESDNTIVSISKVLPNHSEISGMEGKPDGMYRAVVKEIGFNQMKLAIAKGSHRDGVKVIKKAIKDVDSANFELVKRSTDAHYLIQCKENSFQLTRPGDDRPVFRRVENYDENSALIFLKDVEVVAKYQNLVELDNPRTSIREDEIKIELFRITEPGNEEDNAPKELVDWTKPVVYRFEKVGNVWKAPGFQMKITNTGKRTLYFSTLYMEDNFDINNKFMKWAELGPGQTVSCIETYNGVDYKTIPLDWKPEYHLAGVIENTEYIKVIVSTDVNLSTEQYNQEGLELDVPKTYVGGKAGRSSATHPEIPDWATRTIKLTVVHPLEETQMPESASVQLMGTKIKAPKGMSAMVALSNTKEAERGVMGEGEALPPPDHLWGQQEATESYEFTRGINDSPGLSVLEFREISGMDQVHSENPILVETGNKLSEDELIVPMGYDPETGMYYPLGISDKHGEVRIETLPEATPTGTRSLGGSVKIFFQKVVLTKLGFEYKHPQLAMPVFADAEGEEFSYETKMEKVKAAVTKANTIAIFMHGIIGDTTEMAKSTRRIKKQDGTCLENIYDLVLTFDYENLKTEIQETAKDLGKRLTEAGLKPGHGKTVHIIAHSMGGLVSRWYIEKEGGSQVISHLFQVGTPNEGSPWSDVYELASALLSKAVNGAAFLKPYILPLSILGKYAKVLFTTLQQMDPDNSEFLKKLNDGCDPGIPYTIIAGNTRLIPVQYEEQQSILKRIIQRFKKRGHYDALDLLLFKQTNDIAVSVESIYGIKGKEKRKHPPRELEVGCDHISYFADPEGLRVLAQAVLEK